MEPVNPDGLIDATEIGYSQAVVAGDTLYASGQVGWDADYQVARDDVGTQARQAFENVEILLAEVDADDGGSDADDGGSGAGDGGSDARHGDRGDGGSGTGDADLGLDDVAKVTTYLVDPHSRLENYLAVFSETFDAEPYPAHTILGVEQLARPEFLVEVEVEVPI